MKLNTMELQENLNNLYKHISKNKYSGENSNNFIFDEDRILTINDKYSFEIPFEIGMKISVSALEIIKIINGIKDSTIILKKKGDFVILKAGGVKAQIACQPFGDELLESMNPSSDKWKKIPKGFNQGLKLSSFSVSKDPSNLVFNCLYINKNTITSTDDFRISKYNMEGEMKEFLLPLSSALLLSSHNSKKYILDDNLIHFKNEDGSIFHSGLVEGDFPEVSEFFDIKGLSFELPSELQKTIDLVSVLAEGEYMLDKRIKINMENGLMKCKAENETGWIESEIKLKNKKDVSFMVNPVFMSEMLKLSSTATIGDDKIIFKAENFDHLIMIFSEED
jgi:hypothetical protein